MNTKNIASASCEPNSRPGTAEPHHYGEEYFKWQSEIGRFGGWADLSKFSRYIRDDMKVLDFGCGGGYLLANIQCLEKIGIEINPVARAEADRNGVRTCGSVAEIENGWADIIISNHALEHCPHPLRELEDLLPKLAFGGIAVFVFPCEAAKNRRRWDDPSHHLYSWSPMSAANLFSEAGFDVVESKIYLHMWPRRSVARLLRSIGGRFLFEAGCRLYGVMTYLNLTPVVASQVRVVARRKVTEFREAPLFQRRPDASNYFHRKANCQ
ncbi:MAG: class I SAM-dependent methyltransferase [Candidatus Acidiferrales bacterium]